MNLQKELRHKSEDIDDPVLLDVVKALRNGPGRTVFAHARDC